MRTSSIVLLLCVARAAAQTAVPTLDTAVGLIGSVAYEAHLARPHATFERAVALDVFVAGERVRIELREAAPGKAPTAAATWLRDGDGRCWWREAGDRQFVRGDAEVERFVQLLRLAVADAAPAEHEIEFQHPRLGDVADRARWRQAGDALELNLRWHRATDVADFVLRRAVAAPTCDPATAFDVGEAAPASVAAPRAPAPARFRTVAEGVHEITLPSADTRALAIEFADHLVLCETSLDNAAGEQLLACLDRNVPQKPVRFVLFGHYHPHYTGGLRPVMARGATVVAPAFGAAFAREIAARKFRKPPDALAASGQTVMIESFSGQRSFRDDTNELVAIDIGADSHHTDEYVVFWLPRQQLLFEGDLGWFGGPGEMRGGGNRARGLLKAIDDRRLPVQTLLQSWPTTGASTMPIDDFRALLGK